MNKFKLIPVTDDNGLIREFKITITVETMKQLRSSLRKIWDLIELDDTCVITVDVVDPRTSGVERFYVTASKDIGLNDFWKIHGVEGSWDQKFVYSFFRQNSNILDE